VIFVVVGVGVGGGGVVVVGGGGVVVVVRECLLLEICKCRSQQTPE